MTTLDIFATGAPRWQPAAWLAACWRQQRALTAFALLMALAMLPTALALGLDERSLRGVNVWMKPLKFMASVGLFAITTAWLIGLLPQARWHSRSVHAVAWVIIGFGGAEIVYIVLQAALGEASHYNFSDTLHIRLYSLMGLGALAMTATQPVLAWLIVRHGRADLHPTWRTAVVAGLVLTFLLGAGAGGLLGSMQPPAGGGMSVVGWHLAGADLRPAHFLGLHAQQFLPLAGLALLRLPPRTGGWAFGAFTLVYVGLWALSVVTGLRGAVLTVPYGA
jgi:uncharacterized membrane protein